jgi:L-rhamnose mutarotase
MKSSVKIPATLLLIVLMVTGCMQKESGTDKNSKANEATTDIKRVGMVIKLKPEYIEEYRALHADSNSGVRDLLVKANMRNFSIFLHQLDDGNYYEFGYYEYHGNDFEADMAKLAKEDRNIEWLKVCDPMQVPLDGYDGWSEMEQVYYNH